MIYLMISAAHALVLLATGTVAAGCNLKALSFSGDTSSPSVLKADNLFGDSWSGGKPYDVHRFSTADTKCTITVTTASFDTVIYLSESSTVTSSPADLIGYNDDSGDSLLSQIKAVLPLGAHSVFVTGYASQAGSYTLDVICGCEVSAYSCLNFSNPATRGLQWLSADMAWGARQ